MTYRIIHKNGLPYGVRNENGYLLYFRGVDKFPGQEQRYLTEIEELYRDANFIVFALNTRTPTPPPANAPDAQNAGDGDANQVTQW